MKKKLYKSHKFKIPIYRQRAEIIITDDSDELYKKTGIEKEDIFATVYSHTAKENKLEYRCLYFVFNPFHTHKAITNGDLVHEAVHGAGFIFDHIGYEQSSGLDEPFAYLVEYIFNIIEKFYWKTINKL